MTLVMLVDLLVPAGRGLRQLGGRKPPVASRLQRLNRRRLPVVPESRSPPQFDFLRHGLSQSVRFPTSFVSRKYRERRDGGGE
jgi:hypothetical protein